jgi:glycosyltransferase involved in cell wall biosynthesis
MIVKNEEKNILECLSSLKGSIDYVSILDTGSTDNTMEIIRQWGNDNEIPTVVHESPFTSFGEMRTKAFLLAKESFPSDYVLMIDAR